MRTVLILAAGVWIGRGIYTALAKNQAREREVKIRKALEQFIRENLPSLEPKEMQKKVETILSEGKKPL
ncbi:MAG: hypothetical protein EPN85_11935 [Bacteroidetes bacterium]|nr:MAG: hypothetical protein EPN85_11935 [Bacteroidota bacterium]